MSSYFFEVEGIRLPNPDIQLKLVKTDFEDFTKAAKGGYLSVPISGGGLATLLLCLDDASASEFIALLSARGYERSVMSVARVDSYKLAGTGARMVEFILVERKGLSPRNMRTVTLTTEAYYACPP